MLAAKQASLFSRLWFNNFLQFLEQLLPFSFGAGAEQNLDDVRWWVLGIDRRVGHAEEEDVISLGQTKDLLSGDGLDVEDDVAGGVVGADEDLHSTVVNFLQEQEPDALRREVTVDFVEQLHPARGTTETGNIDGHKDENNRL